MAGVAETTAGMMEAEGGPLYYEAAGEGHPFLLLHAWVSTHKMWDEQWEEFAKRYKVIRYDQRGYGRSPVTDKDYSYRQDIHDLLKHLGVEKTYIMGVSGGGQVVIDFTLEHPEMVDALIVVNGGISGYEQGMPSDELMAIFNQMDEAHEKGDYAREIELDTQVWCAGPGRSVDQLDPAFVEKFKARNPLVDPLPEGTGKPIVLDPPAAGRLGEIKVPTLVIEGDQDLPGVLEAMDALAAGVPGAKKVVINDAAHMVNMEKPEEFTRVVLEFLDGLESRT